MPRIDVQGEEIFYQAHKPAHKGASRPDHPPLLLVHGAGGNLMHWPGELRRLPEHTVYALDLPGHGHSRGQGRQDLGSYADVLLGFANALRLPPFVVCGHSMGGGIALEFALRYGGRLDGMVLVATGARLRVAPQILEGVHNSFASTTEMLATWAYAQDVSPKMLQLYTRQLRAQDPQVIHGDFVACDTFDRTQDLGRVETPTLVIGGDADQMTPLKYSQSLAQGIAGAQLAVIPGAGHMVALEQPAAVAQVVAHFLTHLPTL